MPSDHRSPGRLRLVYNVQCARRNLFEKAGIPAAVFATTEFSNAARAQAKALGLPDFEVILVEHPIQPLTAEEVHGRADAVFAQLLTKLTGGPSLGLRAAG